MSEAGGADVIVIGAGVLGTFHAYFAAQLGYRTLLVERTAWPNEASVRNFGMLPQTIVEVDGEWASFARDSAEIYRSIQASSDISVEDQGSLYLASTEREVAVLREFAARYEDRYGCVYLERTEVLRCYPFVRDSYCSGALHFPRDMALDPSRMLRQLIPYVVATARVQYLPETPVVRVEPSGTMCRVIDAYGNVYTADRVIVCSGAEFRMLLPGHFGASGLRICKLQMMAVTGCAPEYLSCSILSGLSIRRYPAFASCPSFKLLAADPVEEQLRDFGIHLLFRQRRDGSVIVGDSHEYRELHGCEDLIERTNPAINAAVLDYGRSMLDLPSWKVHALWNGFYLLHPDGPVYSRAVDETIQVVTGIAGKGMTTGPGFARHSIAALLG